MRRITLWIASTATMLVLLFSYHTSTSSGTTTSISSPVNGGAVAAAGGTGSSSGSSSSSDSSGSSGSSDSSDSSGSSSSGTSGSSGSSGSSSSGSSSSSSTVTGDAVSTRYGDVQVQITVAGGKVTAATVTQVPWRDHKDQEINSYAVPILNDEAVAAQSSSIDMVSGATFTSEGYIRSLQSALDQAGL